MRGVNYLPLRERFLLQFRIDIPSGCWLWTGTLSTRGYGQIKEKYRTRLAHRVSFELHGGSIPRGVLVCHRCDVPRCVNPDHLFLGTCSDNMQDMLHKGRQNYLDGEAHPNAKLTDWQALEIRDSKEPGVILAKRFGVSRTTISEIKTGRKRQQANLRAEGKAYS